MVEYRFKGFGPQGKLVQGTFTVDTPKEAKLHVAKLAAKHQIRVSSLERKRDWLYKVHIGGKKPFSGRQSAYSKDEVAAALRKMGYTNFKINPVLFDINIKPSLADIMMFIKLSPTMLRDKMTFGKILEMLAEEQTNRTFKDALQQIESQLKAGVRKAEKFSCAFSISLGVFRPLCWAWLPAAVTWQRYSMPLANSSNAIWRSGRISRKQ